MFWNNHTPLSSSPLEKKVPEAAPCPPEQEKGAVRKLTVMGCAGKDISHLDWELAGTHHALQIKDHHQILGSGSPPTLTDGR